jgi:hypothetical protein
LALQLTGDRILANVLLGGRPLTNNALFYRFRDQCVANTSLRPFAASLARMNVSHGLSSIRSLDCNIDVKKHLLFDLNMLLSIMCYSEQVVENLNSVRIEKLVQLRKMTEDVGRLLIFYLQFVNTLRIKTHLFYSCEKEIILNGETSPHSQERVMILKPFYYEFLCELCGFVLPLFANREPLTLENDDLSSFLRHLA